MEDRENIDAEREADRAAQEAASIGGSAPDDDVPEEQRAVVEAGGGHAEGFEQSEDLLRENAEHGNGAGDPHRDAFPTEPESGASDAAYGEADRVESTQVAESQFERDAERVETDPNVDDPEPGPGDSS